MTVLIRMRAGSAKANGAEIPAEGIELGSGIEIEGEEKSCEIENQSAVALAMTVGDVSDGGSKIEIPAGATVTVTGPLPVKLEAAHAE